MKTIFVYIFGAGRNYDKLKNLSAKLAPAVPQGHFLRALTVYILSTKSHKMTKNRQNIKKKYAIYCV